MAKKYDMYIDYKRSDKKRGQRRRNGFWIFIVILLAIGLGCSIYAIAVFNHNRNETILPNETAIKNSVNNDIKDTTQMAHITASPTIKPTLPPSPVPTVPTVSPTPQPTLPVMSSTVTDISDEDTHTPVTVKGIYVPAGTANSDKLDQLLTMAASTEINAMVIDVKDDHGKISFQMDCPVAEEIGALTNTISDVHSLIKALKEKNIYLIARIVSFKDPYLAEKRPDLAIRNKDGSLYRDNNGECWVNPYNKDVWDYLVSVATQAAAVGFDEVQFDYIRFSTGEGISKADFGEAAKTVTKEGIITNFTKYAYQKLKPLGVYVSADVYGAIISSPVDAGLVGQNFVEMSKYLDYICPMIYPSHFGDGNYGIQYPDLEPYNIIHKVLEASEAKLGVLSEKEHRAIVRPWLQDFTASWIKHHKKYGGEEVRQEINGVYSAGYEEWLLWNSRCEYSEDGLLEE
jgi:Uncharacterized conserved protein